MNIRIRIDDRQLKSYYKNIKFKGPRQAKRAGKDVLNDQAFSTMRQAKKNTIPRMFIKRSNWLSGSIIVTRADLKDKKMRSIVGGKKKWKHNTKQNFYGLRQQEFGETKRNPAIYSLFSRGGSFAGKVKKSNIQGGRTTITGDKSRISAMLSELATSGYKGRLYIKGAKHIRRGIYKFSGRIRKFGNRKTKNIKMIQDLSHKLVKLKKRPWLFKAKKSAVNTRTTARFWAKAYKKYTMA